MKPKKSKRELRIIFDTNAIFIGTASDLLRKEIVDLIESYSKLPDLTLQWYLPQVVVEERKFQMIKKGKELLPSINKIEKLLGHNLNITEDIIESRVIETVGKQIEKNNLKVIQIETSKIDWDQLIKHSIYRLPPFEDNEKEKGFRDALIVECIQHVVDCSPVTANICRLIFITNDHLLDEAVNERFAKRTNFRTLSSLEELISLINILTAEIKEELINSIVDKVEKLFFTKDDDTSLYYKEKIYKTIIEKYSNELKLLPESASRREDKTWFINKPGFVKKQNQRIHWRTVIEVEVKTYRKTYVPPQPESPLDFLTANKQSQDIVSVFAKTLASMKEDIFKEGRTKFEILWSITLTTTEQLINPKIEEVNYIETIWK
ncbi:MAG: hypothetical protein A2X05_12700 [Bacteroidetes bacterium GWE2_41_25]|nr:MAG: hypothetical protein A2X05_12700 [Bacteroidetes bacterium GWE2_41_25]